MTKMNVSCEAGGDSICAIQERAVEEPIQERTGRTSSKDKNKPTKDENKLARDKNKPAEGKNKPVEGGNKLGKKPGKISSRKLKKNSLQELGKISLRKRKKNSLRKLKKIPAGEIEKRVVLSLLNVMEGNGQVSIRYASAKELIKRLDLYESRRSQIKPKKKNLGGTLTENVNAQQNEHDEYAAILAEARGLLAEFESSRFGRLDQSLEVDGSGKAQPTHPNG